MIGHSFWNRFPAKYQLLRYNNIRLSSTTSQSKNRSWNWGATLSLISFTGLGYFYFKTDSKKKSDDPLSNLEKLDKAEVVFVLGGIISLTVFISVLADSLLILFSLNTYGFTYIKFV